MVPEQFGFRRRYSCVHAINSAIEIMRHCIDDKKSGLGGFVDLKKAFDTIDHSNLLTKLDLYRLRGITNTFRQSYLTNRKQNVSFCGKNSQLKNITFGLPQGSVLGPLLFLLYNNDMPKKVKENSICLFADDTTILTTCKNNSIDKNFNQDLKSIENWCTNNRLTINIDKTQVSKFGRSSKESEISLVNQKYNVVNSFKYLRVAVDNKLCFKQHIDHVCKNLAKFNGILYKARKSFF